MTRQNSLKLVGLLTLTICVFLIGKRFFSHPQQNASLSEQLPLETESPPDTSPQSRAEMLRSRTVSPEEHLEKRVTRYTDGSVDLTDAIQASRQLHQSNDPGNDLEVIELLLQQYRFLFQANPVGTENFEFTAALTGDNPKRVNFIDPHSPALSSNNELLDRWGTAFIFHPLSSTEMELISAGPDGILWTDDDIKRGSPGEINEPKSP